ncbi:MAG: hypothetical protein FWE22_00810 [Firmicutes bacterium]|nr:hypothetical protein [Bacillota bacterium]
MGNIFHKIYSKLRKAKKVNIYKYHYKSLKDKLFKFGRKINLIKYDDFFWEMIHNSFDEGENPWEYLISEYLAFCCNEEDRRFINICFFRKNSMAYTSQNFPLCERSCQEWREEIFKNLIGLALQRGLMIIDIKTLKITKHLNEKGGRDSKV